MRFKLIQQVAAEHFERHGNDRAAFELAVRNDPRIVRMSPELIILAIRLAMILFTIWQQNKANAPTALVGQSFDSVPEELAEEFAALDQLDDSDSDDKPFIGGPNSVYNSREDSNSIEEASE